MPLYEYQCEQCGEVFEVMQKFADAPLKTHERCGGPVHRLLSAPALQFKGSGWYITDYAKNSSSGGKGGEAAKNDGGSKPETTASKESTSSSSSPESAKPSST